MNLKRIKLFLKWLIAMIGYNKLAYNNHSYFMVKHHLKSCISYLMNYDLPPFVLYFLSFIHSLFYFKGEWEKRKDNNIVLQKVTDCNLTDISIHEAMGTVYNVHKTEWLFSFLVCPLNPTMLNVFCFSLSFFLSLFLAFFLSCFLSFLLSFLLLFFVFIFFLCFLLVFPFFFFSLFLPFFLSFSPKVFPFWRIYGCFRPYHIYETKGKCALKKTFFMSKPYFLCRNKWLISLFMCFSNIRLILPKTYFLNEISIYYFIFNAFCYS